MRKKKKDRLSIEEHEALGKELKRVHYRLHESLRSVVESYPVGTPVISRLLTLIRSLYGLRDELEKQGVTDHESAFHRDTYCLW